MILGNVHEAPRSVALASFAGSSADPAAEFRALPAFAAGAEIYAQGERSAGLYRIEFGAVRVYRLLADGRRQVVAFHLAGEVFGFEADATHHFFAEAISATRVRLLRTGARQREFAAELLPVALGYLARVQEHLFVLGRQGAIERVAAFLVEMSRRQAGPPAIILPMSRTDIADYLGLTIETVSRAFSQLRRTGVIALPSLRRVQVVNWPELRATAGCAWDA